MNTEMQLINSAREWIQDALLGWVSGRHNTVVTLAPVAVEHLGKAALWRRSPVLLAILDKGQERSFMNLVTRQDVRDPKLRTIGLGEVLVRLDLLYAKDSLPLDQGRRQRLVAARGGAIHVGHADAQIAENVLSDALRLCEWLAGHLDVNPGFLFGSHAETATRLLDERRSKQERNVDRVLAKAKLIYAQFVASVGPELLPEVIGHREAATNASLPRMLLRASVGADHSCPACANRGKILGDVEFEAFEEIDDLAGPDGYGRSFVFDLVPDAFYCNVCGLAFADVDSLRHAGLPHERYRLDDSEVTPDLERYAIQTSAEYDFLTELHSD